MMNDRANAVLEKVLEEIDLPDGAYERAKERYESIGNWLHRTESSCAEHDPHVFPNGSFRLGLVNRPLNESCAYDLDMTCQLKKGITKESHSQQELKQLVGDELESYRAAHGIKKPMDEKRRCWTLEYSDHLKFHMDIVPCIPESMKRKSSLRDTMVLNSRLDLGLAGEISTLAVSITDNTDSSYSQISHNWRVSNPEGFAKWFESRMKIAQGFLDARGLLLKANIDDLPYYRWRTPLQQAIRILKQHRDQIYSNNPDSKPISVIVTTLAARAYQGESDVASALKRILDDMDRYINSDIPYVPNPVNPLEDFADKWYSQEHLRFRLKENFHSWLTQARAHFAHMLAGENPDKIVDVARSGLGLNLNINDVSAIIGAGAITTATPQKIYATSTAKPWCSST